MSRKYRMEKMSWQEIKAAINPDTVVILPVASIEQHGPHLNVDTDSFNANAVCFRAAERLENTLVAPLMPFGTSSNHINFAGTITMKLDTLKAVIKDYVHSLVHHGFKKIVIMIGHGGNIGACNAAAEDVREELKAEHDDVLVGVTYLGDLIKEGYKCLESGIIWHADEFETSFSLYLNPDEVDMNKAVDEVPRSPRGLYVFREELLTSQLVNYGLPMTDQCTDSGTFGYATQGTVEKGRIIAEELIGNLVDACRGLEQTK